MNQQLPPELYERVINRINYEHKILLLKRKIFAYLGGFSLSLIAFIPLLAHFRQDIIQSSLPQFISLIFSDFSSIRANLGDFSWLILESIPAASAGLTLLALTAFVFSLFKFYNFWTEFRALRHIKI